MKTILFISRKAERCGVADYGRRVDAVLKQSKLFNIIWVEIETPDEFTTAFETHNPDLVLYNYYPVILPFITDSFLSDKRHVPHVVLYHEVGIAFTPNAIIDVDSTRPDNLDTMHFSVPRPLFDKFENDNTLTNNDIVTIGTFGFGFRDKNFPKLAQLVCEQFDTAKIRINTPFATFGDIDGTSARAEIAKMRDIIFSSGKNIILEENHDFLEHDELLNFLRGNDINIFMYEPFNDRSLSGSIDYALSARRPIGISRSWMFRHINWVKPSIFVDELSIRDIIQNGIAPLKPIYEIHSTTQLLNKYEYILTTILNQG
jgi:hypothetical protein